MISLDEFMTLHRTKKILIDTPSSLKFKRYYHIVELRNEWKKARDRAVKMVKKYDRKINYYHKKGIGGGNIK